MDDRICKEADLDQAIAALADPVINKWMKDRGFVRGDFDGGRNLLDRITDDEYREGLTKALRGAAEADRGGYERLMKGFATLTGTDWTPELAEKARILSGDFAEIAPYLYQLAPDLFDELHGQAGSVASLTHAIAEANRDRMSPQQAQQTAEAVFQHLYGDDDPLRTRGFSARQMGQIYQQMARRGMVAPGATPEEVSRALERYSGPLSAVRDTLGHQGWPVGVGDMFHAMDQLAPGELTRHPPEELEQRLRIGDILGQQGGLYSASFRTAPPAAGPKTPNAFSPPLATLAAQDRQLRQQAAHSPVGNLVAATMRLNSESPFEAGSPAARLVEAIQAGEMPISEPAEWLDAMESSGVGRDIGQQVLAQHSVNLDHITPELTDTIRRQQMNIDVQPRLDQITQGYASQIHPQAPRAHAAIQGARDQAARDMGYDNIAHLNALHGAPARGARGILQKARSDAQAAQSVSHLGRGTPIRRMVGAVQSASPQTNWAELGQKAFNMLPKSKFPEPVQQKFPMTFGKEGAAATFRENKTYDPICPHCGEVMYEKHFWPDRENTKLWRHRGPCWDKGPFEIHWPDREKQASCSRTSIWPDPSIESPLTLTSEDFEKHAGHVTTVAVDLDGTIAKPYEKFDLNKIEDPRPGAKQQLQKFKDAGYRVIIFTVRGNTKQIKEYLEKHDLPYDHINENPDQPPGASGKVLADLYIDDRSVSAAQSWKRIGQEAVRRLRAKHAA